MVDVVVKAPVNIKLAGEHSVVYNKPSLSAAIELYYANAKVEDIPGDKFEINLEDLNLTMSLDSDMLQKLYHDYLPRETTNSEDLLKYISKNQNLNRHLLPYATIAARLFGEKKVNLLGKKVTITSEVPIQKGFSSSSVCCTAFAVALMRASGNAFDDQEAIDIARDGDRIIHKVETAGRMDVSTAYFGGYTTFKLSEGIKKIEIATPINIVVINTGSKLPTSEMVKRVKERYDNDRENTVKILDEMEDCVIKCIDSLKKGDLKATGIQMTRNHELLKKLGVSTEILDRVTSVALESGAYGAKLSGGGGGGIAIALVDNDTTAKKIIDALKAEGCESYKVQISLKGAKDQI